MNIYSLVWMDNILKNFGGHMLYSLKEISKMVGLSLSTLRRLCCQGKIPATKFKNRWFFNGAQKRYIKEYAEKAKKFGYRRQKNPRKKFDLANL